MESKNTIQDINNKLIAELAKLSESIMIRRTIDVLQDVWPHRTDCILILKMTKYQKYLYKKLISDLDDKSGGTTFALYYKLPALCNHPVLLNDDVTINNRPISEVAKKYVKN